MRSFMIVLILALSVSPVTLAQMSAGEVIINEVAWMGSSDSFQDEWIELYNTTGAPIDLAGAKIIEGTATFILDNTVCASATCTIPAGGYFIIEGDEAAIEDITADAIIGLGLSNSGELLELRNDTDALVDVANPLAAMWFAGDNTTKQTMERRNASISGDIGSNWGDNDGLTQNGYVLDGSAQQVTIHGTPGQANSIEGTYSAGPQIIHIHNFDLNGIDVSFSEPITQATAENVDNYTFDGAGFQGTASLNVDDESIVHLRGITNLTVETIVTFRTDSLEGQSTGEVGINITTRFLPGISDIAFVRVDGNADGSPDLPADVFFTVAGGVSSVRDFDGRDIVIQDATAGIDIWDEAEIISPVVFRDDLLQVSGQISQYNGKDQLISPQGGSVGSMQITPELVSLADFLLDTEHYESWLVRIADIQPASGANPWPTSGQHSSIEVSDDNEVTIMVLRIDSSTNVDEALEPLWPSDLIGVGAEYQGTYQIQPRDEDDINLCSGTPSPREFYSGPNGTEGVGLCTPAVFECLSGTWTQTAEEVLPTTTDDDCDGEDNNCDGSDDEGADLSLDTQCGTCDNDCTALPNASASSCDSDGQGGYACTLVCDDAFEDCDSDGTCDSLTSNSYCGDCLTDCGDGAVCVTEEGVPVCSSTCADADGDDHADEACGGDDCDDSDPLVHPGATELCDGVDNNCDGLPDETFPEKGLACDGSDADLCLLGTWVCSGDGTELLCDESIQHTESCNGEDDDCDGEIDENWPTLGEFCDGVDDDVCENGILICNDAGNGLRCDEDPSTNKPEICNGVDDDCDGAVDEDMGQYTCGVGECINTVEVCVEGVYQQCVRLPKPEQAEESCNDGLDNDCDGFIDNDDLDCNGGGGGDDGCGCAAGSTGSSGSLALLLLGLAILFRRRH